jgi:hypothetical protein
MKDNRVPLQKGLFRQSQLSVAPDRRPLADLLELNGCGGAAAGYQ